MKPGFGIRIEGSDIVELHFNRRNLNKLPDSIGDLTSLQFLDLSYNQLTYLPESIGNLRSLRYLYLKGNRIKTLPNSIGNLSNLKYLKVNDTRLTILPESFRNLTSLEELYLGYSPIFHRKKRDTRTQSVLQHLKENKVLRWVEEGLSQRSLKIWLSIIGGMIFFGIFLLILAGISNFRNIFLIAFGGGILFAVGGICLMISMDFQK